MSESANSALARRWFEEVWNDRRDATVEELMHSEAAGHMEGVEIKGPEEFLSAMALLLQAFPDLRVHVDGIVAQGDDVVVLRNGRIVEGWDAWNQGRLLQDLQSP